MTAQTFSVPDISCDHCVTAIQGGVATVTQVQSVEVDVATKQVVVTGGERAAIISAIEEAGYEVSPSRIAAQAEQQIDDGVIRVTKWTFPPGSETGDHVHEFDYVVVPITNGELTIESAEGTSTAPLAIGSSYNRAKGVAHNVANDGPDEVAFVEVELLDR